MLVVDLDSFDESNYPTSTDGGSVFNGFGDGYSDSYGEGSCGDGEGCGINNWPDRGDGFGDGCGNAAGSGATHITYS